MEHKEKELEVTPASPSPLISPDPSSEISVPDVGPENTHASSPDRSSQRPLTWVRTHGYSLVGIFCVLLLLIVGVFWHAQQKKSVDVVAAKNYTDVYSFVPEKISKSAVIPVKLPQGIAQDLAKAHISFDPDVKGEWTPDAKAGTLVFHPKDPLSVGKYYAVTLDSENVKMKGDFYVDEDPRIDAIFPAKDSEAPEQSEITIVFNRPMVPLTTLTAQDALSIPVTITPETPGHFKWISTRNLQFIPDTTLIPSSEYTVAVREGFTSVDGLTVQSLTHTFKTRPLRYETISTGAVGYRSPIVVAFNQPFNLDKTMGLVSVKKKDGGEIALTMSYGDKKTYDRVAKKDVTSEDTTKLFIYQKKDAHGRASVWDFDTTYEVTINGAEALFGTIPLEEKRIETVTVPSIVESVHADSPRTSLARPDFLDPQGTLSVTFYDDVNKDSSSFTLPGKKDVVYGTRCKKDDSGEEVMRDGECVKEDDPRTLVFSFDQNSVPKDKGFELSLQKVYARDGFRMNEEPVAIPLHAYEPLKIYRTMPGDSENNAPVDSMVVCSNAPIKNPGDKGVTAYVSANNYLVSGRWEESQYREAAPDPKDLNTTCGQGEFQTKLAYGLLPETDYQVHLKLTDVFDQSLENTLSFRTKKADSIYTRFHNLQKQYNVTSPDKTKLTYAVENLEYVNMHICRLSPEAFLARTHTEMQSRSTSDTGSQSGDCTQVIEKQIPLPHKYWVNNYFQINLAEYFEDVRGQYVLTFSNPLYKDEYTHQQIYDRTYVSVTNLAVGKKAISRVDKSRAWSQSGNPAKNYVRDRVLAGAHNLYWVSESKTLSPVTGATVTQYRGGDQAPFGMDTSGVTDGQGVARVPVGVGVMGAIVRSGSETAVISDWADTLNYSQNASDASRTYIYTDRPIYRPGHTVNIRGIDRVGFDGSYEVWNKEPVTLTLYDSRDTKVYSTKLPISIYGTFNTSFELPADAPLGTYRIEAFGMNAWFDVEEYVPAAFKLEATGGKEEYVNGDTIKIDLAANYYFGVPLDSGTIEYTATAQDYYFDRYTDEYFSFGSGWYDCYSCGYGDSFLFRGQTTIDQNGHATIERPFKFSDYFKDLDTQGSKLVTFSMTARDINGRSVSTQKSFIVHKGDYYIGAITDKYYTDTQTPVTLRIKTVDVKGKPLSEGGLKRTVSKVTWNTFKRQEVDGGFYYRSEKQLKEISSDFFSTDGSGSWSGSLSLKEEGQYEIHIEGKDSHGNVINTVLNMYIYGPNVVTIPPNNNYELSLEVEKKNVEVGDMASILIKSPYPKAKVLITAERGEVYDYWIVDVVGGLYRHQFPITSRYAPNVYITALLLSPDPEIKYGSVELTVGKKEHKLSVEVHSDKQQYLPGEQVHLTVKTKDSNGNPVPAEVSLAVADLSVLALSGNPKKDPLMFFYDGFPLLVTTSANIKNILYETSIPLGTKGGSGSSPEDLAKKKRGLFKDTALWNASVVTNGNGDATVDFTLPDNLTTWQIESLGVTQDTKLGVDYRQFGTKKPLMAVPLKPRFVVPGDVFSLGAHVFNDTDKSVKVSVYLSSDSLTFSGKHEDTVTIPAKNSKTVYFETKAPEDKRAGEHKFTFKATGGGLEDTVEQIIPITKNTTYETVATANVTKDDKATEYLYVPKEVVSGEGGLTINANATLAVFMTDALEYMVTYPYGCSEQLSSSLSTIAIMKRALSVPNVKGSFDSLMFQGVTYTTDTVVKDGLSRIYETQTEDGGFAYYKGMKPNLFLTTHVLLALNELKTSGYEVRPDVLTRATAYIEKEMVTEYTQYPDANKDSLILSEYALRQANGGGDTTLTKYVKTLIADNGFLNEKVSGQSLAYLAIMTATNFSVNESSRVYTALTNRIDIDGRGAYLKNISQAFAWGEGENSVVNTALLLKAFVAHKDQNTTLPNVLRWLLASRDSSGVWGGTHNTFVVVDAMVAYLTWQHETESHFTLKGLLDGAELFTHEFSSQNIFETFTKFVPIANFTREKLIPLVFEKTGDVRKKSNFYYDMALKYFLPVENIPPRDEGITISRDLFALTDADGKTPLAQAKVGDIVRGRITVIAPAEYSHVSVEDMIPAGFEIVNFNLATEDQSLQNNGTQNGDNQGGEGSMGYVPPAPHSLSAQVFGAFKSFFGFGQSTVSISAPGFGVTTQVPSRVLHPSHTESHDDRLFLYVDTMSPGVYQYEYFLRALVPGTFKYLPARAEELYFPEVFGRTSGGMFRVSE